MLAKPTASGLQRASPIHRVLVQKIFGGLFNREPLYNATFARASEADERRSFSNFAS
jgi:hypothetical protein